MMKLALAALMTAWALYGLPMAQAAAPLEGKYEGYEFGVTRCDADNMSEMGQGCIVRQSMFEVKALNWSDWIVELTQNPSAIVTDIRYQDVKSGSKPFISVYYIYNPKVRYDAIVPKKE
ncbi:hypothetical protein Peetri_00019 [Pseudomonas phage vB_PpuM-Peetri]